MLLFNISEARNIDAVGSSIRVIVFHTTQHWNNTPGVDHVEMIHEVTAKHTRGITETIRISTGFRVEEDTCRFDRRGAEHDHFTVFDVIPLAELVNHPDSPGFVGLRIEDDLADNGIRS